MDAFLTIVSKREVREYANRPLSDDGVQRIIEAGRLAGSSRNRQHRRFYVLASPEARERAARGVSRPTNLLGAALAVAISVYGEGSTMFDAGRAAQNMMLAAANDGIGSCPNTPRDPGVFAELLGLDDNERVATVLSFGHPARCRNPESRSSEEWIARADRKPLDELVRWL